MNPKDAPPYKVPRSYLFIGGSWDGRRVRMKTTYPVYEVMKKERFLLEHIDPHQPLPIERYFSHKFFIPGGHETVYILESLTPLDAIALLIAGYRNT